MPIRLRLKGASGVLFALSVGLMSLSLQRIKNIESDYSKIAGEPVEAELVGGALYFYGSELATLRLFRKMPNKHQGWSENLKRFYFCIELSF